MRDTRNRRMELAERTVVAEKLKLALDEVETGMLDYASLRNAVRFQREALKISRRRLEKMGGEA